MPPFAAPDITLFRHAAEAARRRPRCAMPRHVCFTRRHDGATFSMLTPPPCCQHYYATPCRCCCHAPLPLAILRHGYALAACQLFRWLRHDALRYEAADALLPYAIIDTPYAALCAAR